MNKKTIFLIALVSLTFVSCSKQSGNSKPGSEITADQAKVDAAYNAMIESSFDKKKNVGYENIIPDEAQKTCSKYKNNPPQDVVLKMIEDAKKTIVYPANGKFIGDWKNGEVLANIGKGGHVGYTNPEKPDAKKGGNCYACHTLDTKEVAAGTMGISLTNYGKDRKDAQQETAKFVYERIYNAYAYTPCSSMPRFGLHKWVTPEEIADMVAYVVDLNSPVNK